MKYAATKEKRAELGRELSDIVYAAIQERKKVESWWVAVWDYVRDEYQGFTDDQQDGSMIHLPILSARIDGISSQIRSIVLGQSPLMTCQSSVGSTQVNTLCETILHRMWVAGGIHQATDEASLNAAVTNKAIFEVDFAVQTKGKLGKGDTPEAKAMSAQLNQMLEQMTPEEQTQQESDYIQDRFAGALAYAGLKFAAIDPSDFVIFPTKNVGNTNCKLCGKRFTMLAEQVAELKKRRVYFNDDETLPTAVSETSSAEDPQQGGSQMAPTRGLREVELYEVYVQMPLEDQSTGWYKAVIALQDKSLLSFKPHDMSRPPFFAGELVVTPGKNYWPGRSVGKQLAPLQNHIDNLSGMVYDATAQAMQVLVVGSTPAGKTDEITIPGVSWVETDPGSQAPQQLRFEVNVQPLLQQQQQLIQLADSVSVSSNNLGQPDSKELTATQTQAVQSGEQSRVNSFIGRFVREFPQMAAYSWELLVKNMELWVPLFLTQDELQMAMGLQLEQQKLSWTVAGQSVYDAPAQRLAVIQQMAQMAADPAYGINKYNLASLMGVLNRLPMADSIQYTQQEMQQMQQAQAQQQAEENAQKQGQGNSQAKQGMGNSGGPALPPTTGANGEKLPPQPASSVRPGRA